MIKKITAIIMAALLMISVAASVHAMESPDRNRTGSLNLVMEWEGEALNSGSLTVTLVGEITFEEKEWKFAPIPELLDRDVSLDNPNDHQLAAQLEKLAEEKKLPGVSAPVLEGKASFSDLPVGLYLVTQKEPCEGFSPINPFLISIPQWEIGGYVYDLTAQPKVSLESLPTQPTEQTETEPSDTTEPKLPQTGQLNWPVPVMGAAGLVLIALGWYLRAGKKESHES